MRSRRGWSVLAAWRTSPNAKRDAEPGQHQLMEVTMSTTHANGETSTEVPDPATIDLKLEIHIVPVSDVDRAKEFYERLGWRLDADDAPLERLRIVQFTPPGSGAAVTFGQGLTTAATGYPQGGL